MTRKKGVFAVYKAAMKKESYRRVEWVSLSLS